MEEFRSEGIIGGEKYLEIWSIHWKNAYWKPKWHLCMNPHKNFLEEPLILEKILVESL